jgi:hypothetical protein
MNKGSCPVINEAQYEKAREILKKSMAAAGLDFEKTKNEMREEDESCPTFGGGYQRGGDRRQTIKRIVYAIIALGGANAVASATAINTILPGIMMILNGECGMIGNITWRLFGLENPVCATYNSFLATIGRAITGSPEAIALLTGGITAAGAGVVAIDRLVDRIVDAIEATLGGTTTTKAPSGNSNGKRNNNNGDPSGATAGGRRKTRSRKHKKGKHTRKH